jgi:hypothetical protein
MKDLYNTTKKLSETFSKSERPVKGKRAGPVRERRDQKQKEGALRRTSEQTSYTRPTSHPACR